MTERRFILIFKDGTPRTSKFFTQGMKDEMNGGNLKNIFEITEEGIFYFTGVDFQYLPEESWFKGVCNVDE